CVFTKLNLSLKLNAARLLLLLLLYFFRSFQFRGFPFLSLSLYNGLCWIVTDQGDGTLKKVRKPKPWKHPQPLTKSQLLQLREEFWDTAPHYGGRKEIWDALRAASEADISLAQAIVDSAGVIVQNADLTICYDERGAKYELPKYVLSEPTNLIQES
ncbi:ubiquitin domain-containing protein 1-like, partial [Pyrus x bretschneideri]|uniref:ubiquitin domain-containing protein 1-like n=1 Tax=Pyrus x bretschneideri TaxID=225117 RepID=UPI002030EFDC